MTATKFRKLLGAPSGRILHPLGFKRSGVNYYKWHGDIAYVVSYQVRNAEVGSGIRFTINLGIFVPGVFEIYSPVLKKSVPRVEHCCRSVRVGMLMPDHLDIWWNVPEEQYDKVNQIVEDTWRKISSHVFSYFDMFPCIGSLIESLIDPEFGKYHFPPALSTRLMFASIILFLRGDILRSQEMIDQVLQEYKGSLNFESIKFVHKQIHG